MTEHADAPREDPETTLEPVAEDAGAAAAPARRTLIGPFSARQIGLINAAVVGSAFVLFVVTRPLGRSDTSSPIDPGAGFYRISAETQGLELGQRAPELVGENNGASVQLTDLDGRPVSLASLKGQPVWINFWATWCPPCQRETPVLRETFEAHKGEGLVLLAIDVQEPADAVRGYAIKYGLTYRIGLDVTGAAFRTYRIFGLPSQYFIDREGVIRGRYFGPLTRDQAEQQLKAIMQP